MNKTAISTPDPLLRTPLYKIHLDAGAKIVPFAGYEMPVQYPMGVLQEHLHTRNHAGLFDVSHMGQVEITGNGAGAALESVIPVDLAELPPFQLKYSVLLNDAGGILDDLMIGHDGNGKFYLVINAATKHQDLEYIAKKTKGLQIHYKEDYALLAIQGPKAAAVMAKLAPKAAELKFMHMGFFEIEGIPVGISRSGYTGEDGFEISVADSHASAIAQILLAQKDVAWIGLGARDTLRLEAGLCLYGHDLDDKTTPIEAGLSWTIGKRRKTEGGFSGSVPVLKQLQDKPLKKRVGIKPVGRAIAREGVEIQDMAGKKIGVITSGTFSPTLQHPIAMGYVESGFAAVGTKVQLLIRGTPHEAEIAAMPFVPQRYYRG